MKAPIAIGVAAILFGGLPAIFLAGFACRDKDEPCLTCPPPPYVQTIFLDTAYTEPTEVGLRVVMTDSTGTSSVQVFRDTTQVFFRRVLATDTTIIDASLLPARTYTYKAYRLTNGQRVDSSSVLMARTMDTTSHNFTWEIDTLGDGNSSVLYDVAIVSDTSVWAVGEIYLRDSTGQFDNVTYNVARWNSREWKLSSGTYVPFRAVYAFSDTDVWAGTSAPYHWDGSAWRGFNVTGIFNGYINKIWGTSSSDVYIVGTNGSIAHWDGTSWQKLESGTTVAIQDIWGVVDEQVGQNLILCAASNILELGERKILRIKQDQSVDTIPWVSSRRISSLWYQNQNNIFTAGGGVFKGTSKGDWKEFTDLQLYFTSRVRGTALNDIFVVGHFGFVAHWNGINWRSYPEVAAALYYSCDDKNNLMVAVGDRNARAVVLRGTRSQ